MQFPSPWLSEIAKPFSNAVLFKACDSSVLLDSMRASRMICWSTIEMGSPVNGRWTTYHKIEVISCQFNRRWCTGLKLKTADNLINKYCGLQRTKWPHANAKIYFGFGLIDEANKDITCHRSCSSILFKVILWNVIFLGFFNTCKV